MALELRDISLVVTKESKRLRLVEGVSLRLKGGESLGLMGPSGSGKSSLLRQVVGLDPRSRGEVRLDGEVVSAASLPEFRRQVALVPQNLPVFGLAAPKLGRELLGADRADALDRELAALGLEDLSDRLDGDLSGGELRRLHLALALAAGVRFLVLDEPTTGLDDDASRALSRRLRAYVKGEGGGLIAASHDEFFLARSTGRVMVLFDGEVQAQGLVGEVIPAACRHVASEATA